MGRCVNYGFSDKGTLGKAFNLLVVQVILYLVGVQINKLMLSWVT